MHEDGTIKIWDSSGFDLILLDKIKTQKILDKKKSDQSLAMDIDSPLKITCVYINNMYLAVAGAGGHVTLYKYYTKVSNSGEELADMPVNIYYILK